MLSLSSVFLFRVCVCVCAREASEALPRGAQLCAIGLCVLVAIGARRGAMSDAGALGRVKLAKKERLARSARSKKRAKSVQ